MPASAVLPLRPLRPAPAPAPASRRRSLEAHPAARRMRSTPVLRTHTGEALVLDRARWHAPASPEERALLTDVTGPVIELGCGPGRLVVSLAEAGVDALGVDSSPAALALARQWGAAVVDADVFGPLPGEGRWATCLLFDGTIGIGGDPARLLARCRQLLGPRGRVVAEVGAPGTGWRRLTAWFERDDVDGPGDRPGDGRGVGPTFDWAVVGADAIADLAGRAGFEVTALTQTPSGRWFADLQAPARRLVTAGTEPRREARVASGWY